MPRVFLSSIILEPGLRGEEFDLDFDTAKKLTRVLRLTPGETFVAFDGLGREWECALVATESGSAGGKSKGARAVILAEREVAPTGPLHLAVAQAVPKGDKMDFILQKGTELGVVEFWPFDAERSVSRLLVEEDPERATTRAERWRKIAAQAAAQSGRADVPIVHAICDFATVVGEGTNGSRCFMLDELPETEALRMALQREPLVFNEGEQTRIMLLIGPEGGWTQREREWAERYGVEAVGLGRRILRTETAAMVASAILQWEAGEIG